MNNYKVLLVEDEMPARTVFRNMLEARSDLFTLVGEAEDGRDGLELFLAHKPQLIVTDITMPGMNGLDMLRAIEQSGQPQPQAVILTCHQDFHYAQQAIHLKTAAYLIKDDCLTDPGLLMRTLTQLADKAVSEDATREKQRQLEQKVRSNEIEIEMSLFLDMLRNPSVEAKWMAELEASGISVTGGLCKMLLLELDRSSLRFPIDQLEELRLWQFAGVNVLKELLASRGPNKVIALDKGRFFAIFATERPLPGIAALPEQIVHAFSAYLKMSSFAHLIGFRAEADAAYSDLKGVATAAYPFFYRHNSTVSGEEWQAMTRYRHIPESYSRFWVKVLKQALLEPHLSAAALEQERSSLYGQAAEQLWDPEQIKSLYARVFLDIGHFIAPSPGGTDVEASFRKELDQCQTFQAVHDCTFKHFRKLQLQGNSHKMDLSISRIVQRMREDLSYPYKLEELAASISYSVPYFSTMFKKTTGETFVQYLTRIRVEKAKLLLLTTDRRTFEIAEAIGFENYRSFNRIFKKETGVTPSDFRKNGTLTE